MTKTDVRLEELKQAFVRLQETNHFPIDLPHKESTVQRFEFTFELSWKVMQDLVRIAGKDSQGPKSTIRSAAQLGLITDPESWFEFLQDRNETTHMYKMVILEKVYQRIPQFISLVESFIQATNSYLESENQT